MGLRGCINLKSSVLLKGEEFIVKGHLKEVLEESYELLKFSERIGDYASYSDALYLISVVSRLLGNIELSVKASERGVETSRNSNYSEGLCMCLISRIRAMESRKEKEGISTLLKECERVCLETDIYYEYLRLLGDLKVSDFRYKEGIRLYDKAADLATRKGDKLSELKCKFNLGVTKLASGDLSGRGELKEVMEVFQSKGYKLGMSVLMLNLGISELLFGETKKALDYSERVIEMSKNMGDRIQEMRALFLRADALYSLGKLDEAIVVMDEGLEIAFSTGHHRETTTRLLMKGLILLDKGEIKSAEEILHTMREYEKYEVDKPLLNFLIGKIEAEKGNYEIAEKYLREAIEKCEGCSPRIILMMKLSLAKTMLDYRELGEDIRADISSIIEDIEGDPTVKRYASIMANLKLIRGLLSALTEDYEHGEKLILEALSICNEHDLIMTREKILEELKIFRTYMISHNVESTVMDRIKENEAFSGKAKEYLSMLTSQLFWVRDIREKVTNIEKRKN